jgi:hypothetical protein
MAIDQKEQPAIAQKVAGKSKNGGFLYTKGTWIEYTGEADSGAIQKFLGDHKCGVVLVTPTPEPTPMEELPELADAPVGDPGASESPADRAAAFKKRHEGSATAEDENAKVVDESAKVEDKGAKSEEDVADENDNENDNDNEDRKGEEEVAVKRGKKVVEEEEVPKKRGKKVVEEEDAKIEEDVVGLRKGKRVVVEEGDDSPSDWSLDDDA